MILLPKSSVAEDLELLYLREDEAVAQPDKFYPSE